MISLAVRLLIPDAAAVSARRALQAHGLRQLADLQREQGWSFDADNVEASDAEQIATRLLTADVIVNQNKHRARWWLGTLEQAVEQERALDDSVACLLVETRDDPDIPALQRLLTARLGFKGLRVVRHATLWWVGGAAPAEPPEVAKQAASGLLVNVHGQTVTVLVRGPSPVGEG